MFNVTLYLKYDIHEDFGSSIDMLQMSLILTNCFSESLGTRLQCNL